MSSCQPNQFTLPTRTPLASDKSVVIVPAQSMKSMISGIVPLVPLQKMAFVQIWQDQYPIRAPWVIVAFTDRTNIALAEDW